MGGIANRIKALPPRAELAIVVVLAFGWFVYASLVEVVALVQTGATGPPNTEAELIRGLVYEAIVLVALGWFLHVRGWTLGDLGLDPRGSGTSRLGHSMVLRAAQGMLLVLAASAAYQICYAVASSLLEQRLLPTAADAFPVALGVGTLLGLLVINSLFEELFLCGYLIPRLSETQGLWVAVNVSTAIRLSYHLYQGAAGVVSIITAGLVFGYWFARTRQLWPLVAAHGYLNFVAWVFAR